MMMMMMTEWPSYDVTLKIEKDVGVRVSVCRVSYSRDSPHAGGEGGRGCVEE